MRNQKIIGEGSKRKKKKRERDQKRERESTRDENISATERQN